MFAVSVTFLSMSQAATAVCGDDAVATLSALSRPLASMAGVTHGKNFVGDVLLEIDVVRERPGTMSGLLSQYWDVLNLKERGATFSEGPLESCIFAI